MRKKTWLHGRRVVALPAFSVFGFRLDSGFWMAALLSMEEHRIDAGVSGSARRGIPFRFGHRAECGHLESSGALASGLFDALVLLFFWGDQEIAREGWVLGSVVGWMDWAILVGWLLDFGIVAAFIPLSFFFLRTPPSLSPLESTGAQGAREQ